MATNPPKPILNRFMVYFIERFPVLLYLPFVAVLYLCMSFLSQLLSGIEPFINRYSFVGIVSTFFIMLLIRTFDDLKDEDLDHEIFPNRPVSRGAVLIEDVQLLAIFSFVVLVLNNYFFAPRTIFIFSFMMLYALLTFKWFFAKELHIRQPKVAMITHQPLPFIIMLFLLHTTLASGDSYNPFTLNHFYLWMLFAMPITAWEVSRKIKAKINENKYETFSKIFGIKIAVMIPIIMYSIAGLIAMWIAYQLNFHFLFFPVMIGLLGYLNFFFIRFLKNPIPENNVLQKVAMTFTSLLFLTIIFFLLLKYPIQIN